MVAQSDCSALQHLQEPGKPMLKTSISKMQCCLKTCKNTSVRKIPLQLTSTGEQWGSGTTSPAPSHQIHITSSLSAGLCRTSVFNQVAQHLAFSQTLFQAICRGTICKSDQQQLGPSDNSKQSKMMLALRTNNSLELILDKAACPQMIGRSNCQIH